MENLPFALPPVLTHRVTPQQWQEVLLAYRTPPREYHHAGHVGEVFAHYDRVADGPGWQRPLEVALAILYHDAIYAAGRRDNESRSAALAASEITRWMPEAGTDIARVVMLIELTARHGSIGAADLADDADGDDARLFLDCDIAILGADAATFDAYDSGIAAEYRGHVPGWLFRRKRRAFLQSLLARPRIYLSGYFHERLDAAARRNLQRALDRAG